MLGAGGRYELDVVDVYKHPEAAVEEQIVALEFARLIGNEI